MSVSVTFHCEMCRGMVPTTAAFADGYGYGAHAPADWIYISVTDSAGDLVDAEKLVCGWGCVGSVLEKYANTQWHQVRARKAGAP